MGQQNEYTSLKDRIAQVPPEQQAQLAKELQLATEVTNNLLKALGARDEQTMVEELGVCASQMPEFTLLDKERAIALGFIQQIRSKQLDIPTGLFLLRDTLRQFNDVLKTTE